MPWKLFIYLESEIRKNYFNLKEKKRKESGGGLKYFFSWALMLGFDRLKKTRKKTKQKKQYTDNTPKIFLSIWLYLKPTNKISKICSFFFFFLFIQNLNLWTNFFLFFLNTMILKKFHHKKKNLQSENYFLVSCQD